MIIFIILGALSSGDLQIFFGACSAAIFAQLFMSIIPINYPSWLFSYHGYASDGRRFLEALRGNNDEVEE